MAPISAPLQVVHCLLARLGFLAYLKQRRMAGRGRTEVRDRWGCCSWEVFRASSLFEGWMEGQ